jgi:hypothetical protein
MADFLTRLAERALDLFPVARPTIAPMFAPGPTQASDAPLDGAWEDEAPESVGGLSRIPKAPAQEAPMVFSRPASEPPPLVPLGEPSSVTPMSPLRIRPDTQLEPSRHAESDAVEQVNVVPSQEMTRQKKDANLRPEPARNAHLISTPPRTPRPQLVIRPQVTAYREAPQGIVADRRVAVPTSSSSPSTIRVSIGRIEVKAMMPPAPPPASPKPGRPAPRLSLEEYLKQRNGRSQ